MKYVDACEQQAWHLMLVDKNTEEVKHVPYRCHSWRHGGECCRWRAAQDFARIREAIERGKDWTYLVLTYSQNEWPEWKEQYLHSCRIWSALRLRLRRRHGNFGYIQTWERHKKGGLHVNVLVTNRDIASRVTFGADEWITLFLRPAAIAVGFGERCWAERLRADTSGGMAGYLTKLANELVGAVRKSQIPFDAPKHFRRLRASAGLLPAKEKSDMTGWLIQHPLPFTRV